MVDAVLDTHAFVKRLTGAGMPVEQAEVLADEQARLVNEQLATKADIALLQRDLKDLETALRREIEALGYKLTIRLGGMLVVGVAVLAALIKLP